MEEDEPRREGPEAERTMGLIEEEAMSIMDGIDVIMQESIFINVVLEETMLASSLQELLSKEGGVTQEPPSTCATLDTKEELDVGTHNVPREPMSTSK